MNDECMYCGGTGNIIAQKIEVIKINSTKKELDKEEEELKSYVDPGDEKLYGSNRPYKNKYIEKAHAKLQSKKARQTKPEIYTGDSFGKIGPENPNRLKIGETRDLGVKKGVIVNKKKR